MTSNLLKKHQKNGGAVCLLLLLNLFALPLLSIGDRQVNSSEKCRSNVCFNDGQCFVSRGGGRETKFFCECRSGFAGLLCELQCEMKCQNGGKCQKTTDKGEFCECPEGFHGPLCGEKLVENPVVAEVEDCRQSSRGCPFAHVCLQDPESGEFHCERNLCLRWGQSPCANNATCRPIKNDFVCECKAGFDGRHCADDIDECQGANVGRSAETVDASSSHAFGGDDVGGGRELSLLRGPCQNGGKCVNLPGTFECQCPPGFEGPICQHHIGTCVTSPCGRHGKCKDTDNRGNYRCQCHANFTGTHCEMECQPPRIVAPSNASSGTGGAECMCPAGKAGDHCELDVMAAALCAGEDGTGTNGQCQNGGQCVPAGTKAFCICPTGFSGPKCEHRDLSTATTAAESEDEVTTKRSTAAIDHQSDEDDQQCRVKGKKCLHGGQCVQHHHENGNKISISPYCKCVKNFTGIWCEQKTVKNKSVPTKASSSSSSINNHCTPNPCLNEGKCVAKENGPFCECPTGLFTGTRCQLKCHCLSDEVCTESEAQRGLVECYRNNNNGNNNNNTNQTQPQKTSPILPPPFLASTVMPPADEETSTVADQHTVDGLTLAEEKPTVDGEGSMNSTLEEEKQHTVAVEKHTVNGGPTHTVVDGSSSHQQKGDQEDQDEADHLQQQGEEEDYAIDDDDEDGGFGTLIGLANSETTVSAVSNCSECANGAKCVRVGQRIRCLCGADFAGTLCNIKKPLCAALKCHRPGELCQPIRGQPGGKKDMSRCECPPGMGGKRCSRPNTMALTNGSVVLLQSAVHRNKSYSLSLGIRTTLPTTHLASGENALGQNEYTMLLKDGTVHVQIGANSTDHQSGGTTEVPIRVNDDDWYQLRLWSTRTRGTAIELWHPETGYLLAHHLLSSEHKLSQVLTTRIGQQRGDNTAAPFVGCMRAVALNGAEPVSADDHQARAINVQPGCHRQQQCVPSSSLALSRDILSAQQQPCANGGVCVDLWDRFMCRCPRPFLPPRCAEQPPEATFGNGDQPSNCVYALSTEDKHVVAEKTQISFLLRTADHRHGPPTSPAPPGTMPLFYIGETFGAGASTGAEPDTSTFIAAQLRNGVPQMNARLGGKQIYSIDAQERVDDGKVHLLEVNREGNLIKLKVDDGQWHSARIARSFEHPLLADQLIVGTTDVGTMPNLPIDASGRATTGNASSDHRQYLKGTLQDFRLNERFVPFFQHFGDSEQSAAHQFGHKLSDQNLLQGTVSDDVCGAMAAQKPCGQHGTCVNIFNNFECRCAMGWMGLLCEQRDFCGNSLGDNGTAAKTTALCPVGTECQNLDGAFVCASTASLFASSSLRYTIHQFKQKNVKIANFTFEIRTRTLNGHLIKLQCSNHSLIVHLKNGALQLSNGIAASKIASADHNNSSQNITDGQWHKLVISQNAKGENDAIALSVDGTMLHLSKVISFSLAHFGMDKLARISVGRVPEQDGFKGCLRNVRAGPLPPLIFHALQKVPRMADAMAQARLTHFELQYHENVVPSGCQSSNVCAKNPCLNGGTCEDLWNAMRCQCAPGFEGEHCEVNRDECESQDGHAICAPNGKCVDLPNGFRCACAAGFSGPKCTHAEELCRAETCKNGAKCHTLNGTAVCECGPKLIGAWCQLEAGTKCSEEPCQNGGRCFQSEHGQISCRCKPGFTGPLCELRVDPCRDQPCANGGVCMPSLLSTQVATSHAAPRSSSSLLFHCDCTREFEGALCERLTDTCSRLGARAACTGNGKCENVWGGHRCLCDNAWRGRDCSARVDACAEESPCVNGGTCVALQHHNGTTTATSGGGAAVHNTAVGAAFSCQCPPFYLGDRCELAGPCADSPCRNGGECVQLADVDNKTNNNKYTCRCKRNFRGTRCEQRVDVCSEQEPCQNGGTCVPLQSAANDGDDDFRCTCIPGFTGKKCEVDIDECAPKPCLHGGHCTDRVNSFECYCNGTGYTGLRCEKDIDECAGDNRQDLNNICLNGGRCTNLDGDYQCECRTGYIGKRCHMANPCEPNPLTNRTRHNCAHGRCVRPRVGQASSGEEFVQHECECMEGFTGELCMHLVEPQHQLSLSNFVGAGVVLIVLCVCLVALLYFFVICARRKRANEGTYSPSNQELAAQARLFSPNRQFQRQPLHRNQLSAVATTGGNGFVHKTRRKKF
ncbi:hypothetical protein niasHS_015774 [Heterodera schachtii]|uniref:Uncharacterized protein n=1 Tax=Heterodera schachtii TaxID=97005 RepID=A0ABD2HTB9_HETSC